MVDWNKEIANLNVVYGEHTVKFADVPFASLKAMVSRGVTHFLGSEQASKVSTRFNPENIPEGVTDTPEARAAYKAECVAKALEALHAGTVGVSTRGPAKDPLESAMESIARKEITDTLKANDLKFVKVEGQDEKVVQFANGQTRTMAQMIEKRLADHGARIKADAEKALREAARKAAKLKVEGPKDAATLGL